MRRRLVSYFDRRDRRAPDELADETLNRIGRTLVQTGVIATKPPARYCYVVARFVLLEDFRRERNHLHLDEPRIAEASRPRSIRLVEPDESELAREDHLDRLDYCLQQLPEAQRDLIVGYYRESRRQKIEDRRELARKLGITMNALGIRVSRIRESLRRCMQACRLPRKV